MGEYPKEIQELIDSKKLHIDEKPIRYTDGTTSYNIRPANGGDAEILANNESQPGTCAVIIISRMLDITTTEVRNMSAKVFAEISQVVFFLLVN